MLIHKEPLFISTILLFLLFEIYFILLPQWKMNLVDFGYLIVLDISAFVSTNIDDIFLLIMFFSNYLKFLPYQVVIGQYIGIGLLIELVNNPSLS
jgi:hypothetical protein